MAVTENDITNALKKVKYPGFSRDIVSFGILKTVELIDAEVTIKMSIATRDPAIPQRIHDESMAALEQVEGLDSARIEFDIQEPPASGAAGAGGTAAAQASIPGIRHIIAVGSGKGGVGKSTVSANLATALAHGGARVGLCDCDLYGPSIARMFGVEEERPLASEREEIIPIQSCGIKLMSMGFLLDADSPVIVRGPLATRYTQQFLRQVAWGELDFLILDLPPGTGDIQLTIVQTVALSGAIIVTTPQEIALIDARKAAAMFSKVHVPILGIIENMSYFLCPSDNVRYNIFGEGGGATEAKRLGVPLLAEVPIDIATRAAGDSGTPVSFVGSQDESDSTAVATIFQRIAADLVASMHGTG